jgi:hypothetical protein
MLVADVFVSHQLRVNEIYLIARHRPIPIANTEFVQWTTFGDPVATAPTLIPDGYFEIATHGKPITAFLEVDLGHESRAVWRAKVEAYLAYAVSGHFAKRFGHPQFRVLVIADSDRRVSSLRTATAAITPKIFWFTTFDAIRQHGFWSAVWQRAKDDACTTLIEKLP